MTRITHPFVVDRELVIVEAVVVGKNGRTTDVRLVVDTGSSATTLTPKVMSRVGYSRRDAYKDATVTTAIGEERGYWIHVAELDVLGVATPDFPITVFALGHRDIDGLVGMNFLRNFNFEVRPAERLIHLDLLKQQ
jgi:clan AA aspartic protease (TIGR02281 family)